MPPAMAAEPEPQLGNLKPAETGYFQTGLDKRVACVLGAVDPPLTPVTRRKRVFGPSFEEPVSNIRQVGIPTPTLR